MKDKSLQYTLISMLAVCISVVLPTYLLIPEDIHKVSRRDLFGQQCIPPNPKYIKTEEIKPEVLNLFKHQNPIVSNAVNEALAYYSRDPALMLALIEVESNGVVDAISYAEARGLTQLLPSTAEWVAKKHNLPYYQGIEFNPGWNVRVGSLYIEYLIERFDGNYEHALTAYNRGPRNVRIILNKYGKLPDHVKEFYSDKVLKKLE